MVPQVELNSLSISDKLGDGGEGEVFRVSNHSGQVLKLFKDAVRHELNETGLIDTVGLLSSMDAADRKFIESRSVWPSTVVRDNGVFVGFLMPILPQNYFVKHGQRGNPVDGMNDWNKLTFRKEWCQNPNLESSSPSLWYPTGKSQDNLNDVEKEKQLTLLRLLHDAARIFDVLHRYDIVVGDVSGRNILWSGNVGDTAMLIDCDGCRLENSVGVTRAKQSPEWFDPSLSGPTNIQSDLYKLAVAIYRGYFSDGLGLPSGNKVPLVSKTDRVIFDLSERGVGNLNRPVASEWIEALSAAIFECENAGRPMLGDWREGLDPTRRKGSTPIDPDADRPTITWN
jgi:hypothetical protein